jgi:hypothetical protein
MSTVDPPACDDLWHDDIPECSNVRDYDDLVIALMEVWDVSKPEAERRMEPYSLGQCEWLIRKRWGVYD